MHTHHLLALIRNPGYEKQDTPLLLLPSSSPFFFLILYKAIISVTGGAQYYEVRSLKLERVCTREGRREMNGGWMY